MFRKLFNSKRSIFGVEVSDWLIVTLALAVFSVITLWTITKSSIWFDEAFGAYLIKFNFWDIARYTSLDVHPPLFYWLLKLWSMLFGNTELALRSMSLFFGGIAIVFGYLLVNKLFSKKAARISLIFMVLLPMMIRYSQEARMYTLVTAIALAATYVLTFAINTKKKLPWIIYGILVVLGMLTHYFAAIIWIAHWIWRADIVRRVAKKSEFIRLFFSKEWIIAHIVAIALFIPWLPFFVAQIFTVEAFGFWIPPVNPDTIVNFMTNTVYYRDTIDTTSWLALGLMTVVVLLGILAFRVYKSLNKTDKQSYRLIITLAFIPMLILFIASMPPLRSSFIDRYLLASMLGIALFIGVTLALGSKFIKPKWRYISTIFIAVLMIIGIANVYSLGNFNKNTGDSNQTRQVVGAVVAKSSDKQPIIAATPWLFYEVVFYSTDNHPVYFINPSEYKFGFLAILKENDQHKIKDISEFAKQNPVVWYVGWIGESELKSPYSNWKEIQEITINDLITKEPEYKAIQFRIDK